LIHSNYFAATGVWKAAKSDESLFDWQPIMHTPHRLGPIEMS